MPIASKKFASTSVNTSIAAASAGSRVHAPNEMSPTSDRSGIPNTWSGSAG